jgi:integrase
MKIRRAGNRWLVDSTSDLKPRVRKFFRSRKAADKWAASIRSQIREYGKTSALTPEQVRDASEALARLKGRTGLIDAAQHWIDTHPSTKKTVGELIDDFIAFKRNEAVQGGVTGQRGLRPAYIASMNGCFTELRNALGKEPFGDVSRADLVMWMNSTGGKPGYTRHVFYRYARMLWRWAWTIEMIQVDPFEHMTAPKLPPLTPDILTVPQALSLVRTANDPAWNYYLPYVCFALFCGLRTAELMRLRWRHVNSGEWVVYIPSDVAKRPKSRTIPIPLNVQLMLRPWTDNPAVYDDLVLNIPRVGLPRKDARKDGACNHWRHWPAFCQAAGVSWKKNYMRHSYASYLHRSLEDNTRLVMDRLGHTVDATTFAHYVQQIPSRQLAMSWWLIAATPQHQLELETAVAPHKGNFTASLNALNVASL